MTGKQVLKILKMNGWKLDRISGSHHIMVKDGRRSVPVPLHGAEDMGVLAQRIFREAGIELDGE